MGFRIFLVEIKSENIEQFKRGEVISIKVPANWGLQPGESLEYKIYDNLFGVAEVVEVGEPAAAKKFVEATPGRCSFSDTVECRVKKIS